MKFDKIVIKNSDCKFIMEFKEGHSQVVMIEFSKKGISKQIYVSQESLMQAFFGEWSLKTFMTDAKTGVVDSFYNILEDAFSSITPNLSESELKSLKGGNE